MILEPVNNFYLNIISTHTLYEIDSDKDNKHFLGEVMTLGDLVILTFNFTIKRAISAVSLPDSFVTL